MSEERENERPEPADTQVRSKRRRWWLWLPAWCFGVLLVAGLAGWGIVGGRSRARWKEFQARHAELRAKVMSAPCTRRPLEGVAVPGNAWKFYEVAFAAHLALSVKDQQDIGEATYSKVTPEADAKAFALLDAHPEIFSAIRDGARCDTYDPPYEWERGEDMPLDWLSHSRLLSRLLAIKARQRRSAGDLDGAIDCVALGFQLGADAGRPGVLISWLVGVAVRGITMAQAGPIASDPALTSAQAVRLEKLMARLEEELTPLHVAVEADRLMLGFMFLGSQDAAVASSPSGRVPVIAVGRLKDRASLTWRHGGSWRLAFAEVDAQYERLSRLLESGESLRWPDAAGQYDAFISSVESDPLLASLMCAPQACEDCGRSGLARIRLIRALCHERATGAPESPLPVDPHSLAPLHRRVDADKTVYWAEWSDGDQGGTGKFEENPTSKGDIVLEWKK